MLATFPYFLVTIKYTLCNIIQLPPPPSQHYWATWFVGWLVWNWWISKPWIKNNFLITISAQPDGENLWLFVLNDLIQQHSLKYLRFTTLGCKDIGIKKSEFWINTQFLRKFLYYSILTTIFLDYYKLTVHLEL